MVSYRQGLVYGDVDKQFFIGVRQENSSTILFIRGRYGRVERNDWQFA